ncbi:hypothetical protein HK099_008706 [Clydaea vesicula]|uniref:Tyrosinase copper-binding domain-containing protein n=1 Tax=Clydaea vesicula TaxID=447962 RepID=A0AAD5XXJ6_9FUNG|nr:hypothetical protein HK099_008706 [Clydaea vesicula]KAJ3387148.1 hypothetical protein HDU92_002129 [Lobulomyces angularis]
MKHLALFIVVLACIPYIFSIPQNRPRPTTQSSFVQCSGNTVRKEVRDMKLDGDLDAYVAAFLSLAKDGTLLKFVNWHSPNEGGFWNYAHFTPRFLPWHRIFLKEFEKLIQSRGGKYVPYWDWSLDSQRPWLSPVLSSEFFGSPNRETHIVDNGYFKNYTTTVSRSPIIHDYSPVGPFNSDNQLTTFSHPQALLLLLNESSQFSEFSYDFEMGPHFFVHQGIGGSRGQFSMWQSPDDPLFFLHHSFVDYMFSRFQDKYPDSFEGSRYGEQFTDITDEEILRPFNIPIKNVLKLDQVCVSYQLPSEQVLKSAENFTGTIVAPSIKLEWFKKTGLNLDQINTIINNTINVTNFINNNNLTVKSPNIPGVWIQKSNEVMKTKLNLKLVFILIFLIL